MHGAHRRHKLNEKKFNGLVIALDKNYMPMLQVRRHHAIRAVYSGRARFLDLSTWTQHGIEDFKLGGPVRVIVYHGATVISDVKLTMGRGINGVLYRDDYVCQYCGAPGYTVDHVIPRCNGGRTCWDNLVACCHPCNQKKGGRSPQEAGMKLMRSIRSPRWMLHEAFHKLVERHSGAFGKREGHQDLAYPENVSIAS